jgi:hypothetical protein
MFLKKRSANLPSHPEIADAAAYSIICQRRAKTRFDVDPDGRPCVQPSIARKNMATTQLNAPREIKKHSFRKIELKTPER